MVNNKIICYLGGVKPIGRELCALDRELSFAGSYASQEFLP
jgi:hypothetical protein